MLRSACFWMGDDMASAVSTPGRDSFVPAGFRVPDGLVRDGFRLLPLSPNDNADDYRAWQSSREHIRRTPGFETYGWPVDMTLDDNRRDLVQHAADFKNRTGFTYSVFVDEVIVGCVYIYPSGIPGTAAVRSWVRADHAHLDRPLYETVDRWMNESWPFHRIEDAPRDREGQLAQR
jgi:hypothetical protein